MKITAQADRSQLDDVDITLTVTMKLKDWKMIRESVRSDVTKNYHWTKVEFANIVQDIIDEYSNRIESEVKSKE